MGTPFTKKLERGRVYVWFYNLDVSDDRKAELATYLNQGELDRAEQYRFVKHQSRFVVGRGILREIMAYYLGVTPRSVRFSYSEYGKPHVGGSKLAQDIKFNTSSSQHLGAAAITLGDELGLDLEQIRPIDDCKLIVENEFPEKEKESFLGVPEEMRLEAFYDLWTCKEAYLKGKGLGLNASLKEFVVSANARKTLLLSSAIDEQDPKIWSFHRSAPDEGFSACLAVEGGCSHVHSGRWPTQE